MKIQKILSQHRRDFTAIYECEHCGDTYESRGYDDANFHKNVVPNWECRKCGKKAEDASDARATRYPEGMVI